MRNSKALVFPALMAVLAAALAVGPVIGSAQAVSDQFTLPGVVAPTACRVGAVLSGEQFTTTGFSNVRTVGPNSEQVAGFWVVADNFVQNTSVVGAPNCENTFRGDRFDDHGMNLMGVRIAPTQVSAGQADIQEVSLVQDVNLNGQYDPLLDQVLQTKPGSSLDTQQGAVFHYGPQAPLAVLNSQSQTSSQTPCDVQEVVNNQTGSSTFQTASCAIGLLAIVNIGDQPETGSQFGLQLEALAGDAPGTPGNQLSAFPTSSGFSSSQNPQASNVRLQLVGGQPGSATPISHISNGSGNPEAAVRVLDFGGGAGISGTPGLKSRFRGQKITPGQREAIAIAVGICDGGQLANTNASILPAIAGAPPSIAGGLSSLPCIPSDGLDSLATGINGATLIFSGELAQYMGNVRMYVDTQSAGQSHAYQTSGGGNGVLFEPGELVEQVTPQYNESTGEAIATFGGRQEQVLFTQGTSGRSRTPVANLSRAGATQGADTPTLIVFTVDVDSNAPSGTVDVKLGLQSYDDTAQNRATTPGSGLAGGGTNPCVVFGPKHACGSNFLNEGPATDSFKVEAAGGGQQPDTGVAQYDTNGNGVIDDSEFMTAIDEWVAGSIQDNLFFDVLNAWVEQTSVSSAGVSGLSLNSVDLSSGANGTTFAVSGQAIENTSVEVYSLDGSTVFSGKTAGNTLSWNHTMSNGQPVANGVYLYRVTVEGANGETVTSEVKKLTVVR